MIYIALILLFVFLLISGFFSGSETTLFSLSKLKLEDIKQNKPIPGKIIDNLLKKPEKLLITILICNILVNILITTISEYIFSQIIPVYSYWIALLASSILILIFGEVTPKSIAIRNAKTISVFVSPIIWFFNFLLTPVSFLFQKISNFSIIINSKLFYYNSKEPTHYNSEAVIDVIKHSQDKGVLDTEEGNILGNLIQFSESDLNKIAKPRNEIFSISIDTPIKELTKQIKEKKYSRIPIWEDEEENIIGILHVKDLIKINGKKRPLTYYRNYIKKPIFVPDSTKPEILLKNFQKTKNRLAIVIDEYGGVAGLVTLEDVLEEIIGEVVDKGDVIPLYHKYSPNIIEIEAKMEITEFNNVFDTELKSQDAVSVGGYVLNNIRKIPEVGEIFIIENLQFKISGAKPNKIEKIMITKLHKKTKKGINKK